MIDFPNTPVIGDTHTVDTMTWTWDGVKWTAAPFSGTVGGGGGGAEYTASSWRNSLANSDFRRYTGSPLNDAGNWANDAPDGWDLNATGSGFINAGHAQVQWLAGEFGEDLPAGIVAEYCALVQAGGDTADPGYRSRIRQFINNSNTARDWMAGKPYTLTFWARRIAPISSTVDPKLIVAAYYEWDAPSYDAQVIEHEITLTNNWVKHTLPLAFPATVLSGDNNNIFAAVQWNMSAGANRFGGRLEGQDFVMAITQVQLEPGTVARDYEYVPDGVYDAVLGLGGGDSGGDSGGGSLLVELAPGQPWEIEPFTVRHNDASGFGYFPTARFSNYKYGTTFNSLNIEVAQGDDWGGNNNSAITQTVSRLNEDDPLNTFAQSSNIIAMAFNGGFWTDFTQSFIGQTVTVSHPLSAHIGGRTYSPFGTDKMAWQLIEDDQVAARNNIQITGGAPSSMLFTDVEQWEELFSSPLTTQYGSMWEFVIRITVASNSDHATHTVQNVIPHGTSYNQRERVNGTAVPSWVVGNNAVVTRPASGVNMYTIRILNASGTIAVEYETREL